MGARADGGRCLYGVARRLAALLLSLAGAAVFLAPRLNAGGGRAEAASNLVRNGGFEDAIEGGPSGWGALWTREPDAGRVDLDPAVRRGGQRSARIEHRSPKDWSFDPQTRLEVDTGDVFSLQAWVKIEGGGSVTVGVVTYGGGGAVRNWVFGGRTARGSGDWRRLRSTFVVPRGVAAIHPRVIGSGPATTWLDDFSLAKQGNVAEMRRKDLPEKITAGNAAVSVTLHTADATLTVADHRVGQTWRQRPVAEEGMLIEARGGAGIEMTWLHFPSGLNIASKIEIDRSAPEFTVTLSAVGEVAAPLRFPHPFVTEAGTYLVVPMNEGISYPVGDPTIRPRRLIAYGGHGISMAFWGLTDGERGHMAIIESPDDASIRIQRLNGNLCVAPEWDSQRGIFGYPRRLRYVFLESGGHVAICKRYRASARAAGLVRTLEEKRQANRNVDVLVGAVNVWSWERDSLAIVREMKALGIERILWSHRGAPAVVDEMNRIGGILTSRYDIYQDLMDPRTVRERLRGQHPDWTQGGWPDDLMLDENADWRKGWRVRGTDGGMYPCGVLCDRQALGYARERVPEEVKKRPYRCRFIDTTTASPWRECYHPDHPMNRSDSRRWKMELLRFMSEEMGLVTGSETGHEAAVPYVHYFEGMLSLGPYRVPDAGRRMLEVVEEVPERVARFQVGETYRLPLWELVYHDCVVAQWYWGDYNNKLPALWDKRDLFNILYGTPPMFMFNRKIWEKNKERFVQSYRSVCPVARAVGYAEMTDHRFLSSDRRVQQTSFANGITITVNFGDEPFRLEGGEQVAPMGHRVMGKPR